MHFYVYAHYELDTGRLFYIGKGSGRRARSSSSRNKHWKNIVAKHGFLSVIIADNMTEPEAYIFEAATIAECKNGELATYTSGGSGTSGWRHSVATREAMSLARKGFRPSEDARKRMSETIRNRPDLMEARRAFFTGDSNPAKSQTSRAASSLRMTKSNPMVYPDVKERMAVKLRGRSLSSEHRVKVGDSLRGKKRGPMVDKVRTILAEVQNKRKRPVETLCGLQFESTLAAANALGIRQGNIVNSCKGRQKAGGYQWRYSDPISLVVG